ncbi:MAG: hypothetical protein AAGI01_11220 [Myxococcota bacterium]
MTTYHPLYTARCAQWRRYRLAYEGGADYIACALRRHAKEREESFRTRLERAIYPNHIRSIVDTYAAHLYREPIARESTNTLLQEAWADTDLMGTPASEFYERVAQLVQVGGRAAIVVDRHDAGEARTRAQERALGRRPYVYAVGADELVDWSVDRRGRLQWAVIAEHTPAPRTPLGKAQEQVARWRVWWPDRWQLLESRTVDGAPTGEPAVVEEGEHPVGEVPVTPIFWGVRRSAELLADSAIKDLEPMGRRLTRLVSLIDEQVYQHVFSIMAVPQTTWEALEQVQFSVSGAIPYPDDCSEPPHYIAPDVAQIAAIRSEIETTEAKIRQLSGLGRVNAEGGHAKSGIALSYLTMDKDALLAKFGQRMSRAEASVDRHILGWMEQQGEATRSYPTHFDPLDLSNDLDAALKLVSIGITGDALLEVQRAALRAYLGSRVKPAELERTLSGLTTQLDQMLT